MPRVYVESHQRCMQEVFTDLGWEIVGSLEQADVLVLIGGADIHPSWYDAPAHPQTYANLSRDERTDHLYKEALEKKIAILGICRGGQFVNARLGGSMYQHVNNHAGRNHVVIDVVDQSYHYTNSVHHQMMLPSKAAVCVARACRDEANGNIATLREIAVIEGEGRSECVHIVEVPVTKEEPEWEVLFFPEERALCFQAHPEYEDEKGGTRQYFYKLLKRYYPEWF